MDTTQIEMILDECRVDIQRNMQDYGINASGRTSSSFIVEKYEGGVRLVSRGENIAPFISIEQGKEPGWVGLNTLRQWTINKQIEFNSEEERELFVRSVQWKIAQEGTERFRDPNYNITTPPVIDAVEKLKQAAVGVFVAEINSVISA